MGICGVEPVIRLLHFNFVSNFKNACVSPFDWLLSGFTILHVFSVSLWCFEELSSV